MPRLPTLIFTIHLALFFTTFSTSQTRQTFGAIDSDDDPTAKARQSGWTSTTRPLQLQQPSAVPNPAAAKGKTAPMKKASSSSAKNQWSANDLTLAQQLQMRMVHDIQTDMAAGASSEEGQVESQPEVAEAGTSIAGTASSTSAVVAAEQARSKGRAPAAAAGLSRKHSNTDSDDEGFWEEMAVDEKKFQTKAKQSSKSSVPLASVSPSKQLNPAAEDEDDDEGNSDTEEPGGASTSVQNGGTSKKKRNKANKSKRKTEAHEEEVALQKALAEANTEKTKSAAGGSQGKKAAAFAREATKSGPSAVYALYKKVRVELETNSVMGELILAAGTKPKKSSRGTSTAPGGGAADDEQALAELRSRLSIRNPLGLGQPEATSVAQYVHFFTKWTFAPPMAVPDKPQSTGLVAASSKRKAAAQGQQQLHLLVDPDLATRMRSTVSTFYPVLANVLFLFTVFWYLFLSSSAWVPPAASSRARRNYNLAESIVQSASYIWAWGTTLLLVAQAVFSGVPEAGAALFGEDNKDLYVLALKILHGGVWGMLVFGVVILSSWSYLVGLGILVAGFLSAAKYEGTSAGGGRKEAED